MQTAIVTYLPWLLSVITIWMTLAAGNKHPYARNHLKWRTAPTDTYLANGHPSPTAAPAPGACGR